MPSEGQQHQRQVVRQGRQPGHGHHAYARAMTIAGGGPAKASECARRAYFSAKRAIASRSREESWKVAAKIFTLLLCDLCGLAREISRDSSSFLKAEGRSQPRSSCHTLPASKRLPPLTHDPLRSPHKAEGLLAVSASHTYHLCGST